MCRHFANIHIIIPIFDFLEDNELINYSVTLKDCIDSLPESSFETTEYKIFDNKKIRKRYVSREWIENKRCRCGSPAEFFTSDLYMACTKCLDSLDYPEIYRNRCFHQITQKLLQKLWTKKDEYILLSNIEKYGDEWDKVSIGINKTVGECIFHFLKMSLMDELELNTGALFSNTPNMITSFINYIATSIDLSLSADLAKAAIKYLDRPDLMNILLDISVIRTKEKLEMEKKKIERLKRVECEALAKRLSLKIDSIYDMYSEVATIRSELDDTREKLILDLKDNQASKPPD
jgi:hypothetical protein